MLHTCISIKQNKPSGVRQKVLCFKIGLKRITDGDNKQLTLYKGKHSVLTDQT